MNIGLYLGATALNTLERWQESIANNMASSQVPGYRKREVQFTSQGAGQIPFGHGISAAAVAGQFPALRMAVNFAPGQIHGTGRDLDVAIRGEGFFEVELEDGTRAYTRAGSFHLSPERVLVDAQGRPVLGEGGAPLQLLPDGGPLTISRDGTVSQGALEVGRIGVVRFDDPQQLEPLSGGLFRAPAGVDPTPLAEASLQQGAIESSNVSAIEEMVNLVAVTRAYQAAQKVVSTRDDLLEKTLRALT
jgi:flagellar basal-body rod protein FlgF